MSIANESKEYVPKSALLSPGIPLLPRREERVFGPEGEEGSYLFTSPVPRERSALGRVRDGYSVKLTGEFYNLMYDPNE